MSDLPSNRVREVRLQRGLSQAELAQAADISRQSVVSIEAGRTSPGVDVALRLARALLCSLDELFAVADSPTVVASEPAVRGVLGRTVLAHIAGRWVAHPMAADGAGCSADGVLIRNTQSSAAAELLRPLDDARDNIVLMGCALALGVLSDRLNSVKGAGHFRWLSRSSGTALAALAARQTHLAGVHLVDAKTGEANVADVGRAGCSEPIVLISLARWQAGLVMRPDHAGKVRGVADLDRPRLRIITRESDSGAQRLLQRELGKAGHPRALLERAKIQASGHLELARSIAECGADVGVATRDVASIFNLHFVPLAEERYDLALPRSLLDDVRIQRMLDALTSVSFRRELSVMGYDTAVSGQQVAEVRAA